MSSAPLLPGWRTSARQPADGVPAKPPRTAEPVDCIWARRADTVSKTNMRNVPSEISTLRRQARPPGSYVDALKARLSVGSSTRVTAALATDSPIRPAKNDRPLTTASPDRADAITESRVETTRGSKTTVYRPDWAFWAPSRRVARWTPSPLAFPESL